MECCSQVHYYIYMFLMIQLSFKPFQRRIKIQIKLLIILLEAVISQPIFVNFLFHFFTTTVTRPNFVHTFLMPQFLESQLTLLAVYRNCYVSWFDCLHDSQARKQRHLVVNPLTIKFLIYHMASVSFVLTGDQI